MWMNTLLGELLLLMNYQGFFLDISLIIFTGIKTNHGGLNSERKPMTNKWS